MTTETLSEIHVSYKPGLISSKTISTSKEAYDIIPSRHNKLTRTIRSALFKQSK